MALHGMNKIRDRGLGILIYGDTFHCLVQEKCCSRAARAVMLRCGTCLVFSSGERNFAAWANFLCRCCTGVRLAASDGS